MMLLGLYLLQATAQVAIPAAVPTNWSLLAPMPFITPPQITQPIAKFVSEEIAAGRCPPQRPGDDRHLLTIDVAALVNADGIVRRTVPRAIGCPTVEQYSAGLVVSFARENLDIATPTPERWYRATIVYNLHG